jgi:hypothetical protein
MREERPLDIAARRFHRHRHAWQLESRLVHTERRRATLARSSATGTPTTIESRS